MKKRQKAEGRRRKAGRGLLDRLQDNWQIGMRKLRRQVLDLLVGIGLVAVIVFFAQVLTALLGGG